MKNIIDLIESYNDDSNWLKRENANKYDSYSKLRAYIADEMIKEYTLTEIYPPDIVNLHKQGFIHIHDLSDSVIPYCRGHDSTDLLVRGLITNTVVSHPPKHLSSFFNQLINYLVTAQQEWAGAQAIPDLNTLAAPFVRSMYNFFKDFIHNENNLKYVVKKLVKQAVQSLVFDMNFPSRGPQTAFLNITLNLRCPDHLKDQPVFNKDCIGVYGDYEAEARMILEAFNEVMYGGDAAGNPFTFPLITISLLPNTDFDDPLWTEMMKTQLKYGTYSFQNYIGSGLEPNTAFSMCCLSGDTKIISKGTRGISYKNIKEFRNSVNNEVLINGEFKPGKWFRTTCDRLYTVTLVNNQIIKFSPDHPCITKRGIVRAEDLTINDWMPFSILGYEGEGGSFNLGRIVGLYVAEGSKKKNGITYSLNEKEKCLVDEIKEFTSNNFGVLSSIQVNTSELGRALNLTIHSTTFKSLIEEFVGGNTAKNKCLRSKVFKMSKEFRMGLWDGWRSGDGSSRGRICTVSEALRDDACALLSSIGTAGSITTDNRNKEDGKLGDNPLYLIRGYALTRDKYKDIFEIDHKNKWIWIKLKNIEVKFGHNKQPISVYDFDMDTKEELFQLANGLVTHNCRLSLDLTQLPPSTGRWVYDGGTGSLGVTTLNMSKIGYLAKNEEDFYILLEKMLEGAKRSLLIKGEFIEGVKEQYMPLSMEYGFDHRRFFRTIGILGLNEMCMNFHGVPLSEDIDFVHDILTYIREWTRQTQEETGLLWNDELTPGEGTSYSFAKRDYELYGDDIFVQGEYPECYYTAMITPPNQELGFFERIEIEEKLIPLFTGGTVCRLFIGDSGPSPESVGKLVRRIAEHSKLSFFDLAVTASVCVDCGNHHYGEIEECEVCGGSVKTFARVVGYMRPITQWNVGKQREFRERIHYNLNEVLVNS